MVSSCCEPKDRHLPSFVADNFLRRLFSPPEKKISKFVTAGVVAADIGCGPGYFTIPMARLVGEKGRVYAADSDPKSIRALKAKSTGQGVENVIEAQATSAASLGFIPARTVDFAFSNDVLCCMVDHGGAVAEIKRILKPSGLAYLSVRTLANALRAKVSGKQDPRAVSTQEWRQILAGFKVRESEQGFTGRWAVLSLVDETS